MDAGDLPHVGLRGTAIRIGCSEAQMGECFYLLAVDFVPHANIEVSEEETANLGGFTFL